LEKILELMEKHEVGELEWEKSGERLKLRTRHASSEGFQGQFSAATLQQASFSAAPRATQVVPDVAPAPSAVSQTAPVNTNQKQVVSPFVGTFYCSPSPTAEPYIREGQTVKRGDVLCIIEAMKLMNEIEAEFPGRIVSIMVENGQPVEFGEPLFIVEP
jgi:acetyl-CoA carboxylase biotin carboxyl carrier protein